MKMMVNDLNWCRKMISIAHHYFRIVFIDRYPHWLIGGQGINMFAIHDHAYA